MALGFKVIYLEAGDDGAAKRGLELATRGGRYKADELIFMGHGEEDALALSEAVYNKDALDEAKAIDVTDFLYGNDLDLSRYIKTGGQVTSDSCSTGSGGLENPFNLANAMASTLHGDITVIAPEIPVNLMQVSKKNGRLVHRWSSSNYETHGVHTRH